MKNIKYLIAITALIFSGSCSEDFLEKDPIVGVTDANFYQTEDDAIAAVNAAYAALQFELTPAGHFRWFWGDIMSDDSEKGGSGINDGFALHQLENFQGITNSDMLASEWKANYQGIYRANVALEKVPEIEMDIDVKERVLAEAKFLRAWYFYNLVTIFGGVPKADHVLAPSEYNMPRNEASEIWDLVISDLTEAAAVLPKRSEYPLADIGRATRGAANALLAKSYLWQENWAAAQSALRTIINSNEYRLVTDYGSIFTRDGENNVESIFEIQYMQNSGGNWGENNQNEGTLTDVFQRARGQFEGFGFNIPTQDLVDAFSAEGFEDPRLQHTVFRVGDEMGDRGTFTLAATGSDFSYHPKKYFTNKADEASFGDPNPNGGNNDRVIRYADVLLMFAEASYHAGDEAGARDALNQVRARARKGNNAILADVTASGGALLEAIYHERRVELAMEGHRFFDLVRTGRGEKELGALGYQDATHRLFPIPDSQIQATNGAITQNPGY
ncbi:MAG: RagB/SusD family nutrient uptake outer membrane protein [Saprospiraceae bacterium]